MSASGAVWRNWGRTEAVRPKRVERPTSAGAVQRAVIAAARSGLTIKAVGAGHSFTGIAVAPGVQLDLDALTGLVGVDTDRKRVTLAAGTRLFDIPRLLEPLGLAMPNLGDIDRQSISGAISTGTHGTGSEFTGIAGQVRGAVIVTGDGELLRVSDTENAELLPAVALGLGALGILVEVTLQCVDAFALHAREVPLPLGGLLDVAPTSLGSLAERVEASDHFEFYWFPHTRTAVTKTNTRLPATGELRPLTPLARFTEDVALTNGVYRATCAAAVALPGIIPRVNGMAERLMGNREFSDRSHRVFATRRTVRFREMEYAIPAESVPDALRDVMRLIDDRGWRISFPVEVRFARSDDLWMSTAYGRESGYIAVHRYYREDPTEYFSAVEEIMLGYGGRPHWGKMHTRDSTALRDMYPRYDDFLAVRDRLDPQRVFANPYLNRVLGE
ncbi:D-arabinono-1,4-lactone oxidase [Agreia sp. Leaf283]|uniref:D-arabinono-1,4-lactone oxidase n=1 Tax=Agreia sp. Leaf283 TaxID=1736321 RepID=UPI0006F6CBFC|nr:D-arabinono-1,4-lactone oxidase [Agreia sp. Leaf283]KQP55967.1 FAD-linked oxidoreductase [Agreia sp. Leaf283]